MKPTCSIIIPTFNNPEYLNPCINSIIGTGDLRGLCELIIVNNGQQPVKDFVKGVRGIKVIEAGSNLGWERGLKRGIEEAEGDFLCFQNDDTLIPKVSQNFYRQLLWPFHDQSVGAVGPATTVAAGWHSIFHQNPLRSLSEVSFLIFFTVMIRRSDFEAVGGIDTSCPGGDDLDLSIRLRKSGKRLLVNPEAFIIHHAFKTGTRVHGEATTVGGWNSKEMTDRTNKWLIQKHGFRTFLETMRGLQLSYQDVPDPEGEVVAGLVRGPKIVELGCGARKTVPNAIGVDLIEKGQPCNNIDGTCVADIQADVTKALPIENKSADTVIARHILEHCTDMVETVTNWSRILKIGGRLIIAVPNEDIRATIPLNPEHRHGFTPGSLARFMSLCGFRSLETIDPKNGISFVSCFEKTADIEKEAQELVHHA